MKKMKNRFCYANCNVPSDDLFLFLTTMTKTKTQPWRRWRLGGRPIGKVVMRGSCLLNSAWPAGAGLHQTHAGLASFMQVDVGGDPAGLRDEFELTTGIGVTAAAAAIASEFAVISANAFAVTGGKSPPFLTS